MNENWPPVYYSSSATEASLHQHQPPLYHNSSNFTCPTNPLQPMDEETESRKRPRDVEGQIDTGIKRLRINNHSPPVPVAQKRAILPPQQPLPHDKYPADPYDYALVNAYLGRLHSERLSRRNCTTRLAAISALPASTSGLLVPGFHDADLGS